jgi:hypothetical protein
MPLAPPVMTATLPSRVDMVMMYPGSGQGPFGHYAAGGLRVS